MREILDNIIAEIRKNAMIKVDPIVESELAGYTYSIWDASNYHICILSLSYLEPEILSNMPQLSVSWKKDYHDNIMCRRRFDIYKENCFDDIVKLINSLIEEKCRVPNTERKK
jgi:hypothetical protein